jgi:hypothetical protein
MKKLSMNAWKTAALLMMLSGSLTIGCLASSDAPAGDDGVGQSSVSQSISGKYCVDQNTASVARTGDPGEQIFFCNIPAGQVPWSSTFSRNHPVNVHMDCGTYVYVKDIWGPYYYIMRRDALQPC